ncbi:hypothetical protein AVEN_246971-1 [Araneus ventricosus]|uniref:Uncharacterized protein n=1 Tax=Araneus ventricosus TaxID=182803 RepID=A0A4Y2IUS0_ARAVE|nr:hypothetical protein AVEN_246971-1 [Araneus ventricosus]
MGGVCGLNYYLVTATTVLTGSTSLRPPILPPLTPGHAMWKQSRARSYHPLHFTGPTGPLKGHRPHRATQTSSTPLGYTNITDPTGLHQHHRPHWTTQTSPTPLDHTNFTDLSGPHTGK